MAGGATVDCDHWKSNLIWGFMLLEVCSGSTDRETTPIPVKKPEIACKRGLMALEEERRYSNLCMLELLAWNKSGKEKEKSWTQALCGCKF